MTDFYFSLVVPVYNALQYIDKTMESIVGQTIGFSEHIQVILVDDGSTDGSAAKCDEWSIRYPENILTIHQQNRGAAQARKNGLSHAVGRYISFPDSDDWISPDTCALILDSFSSFGKDVDIVAFPIVFEGGRHGPHPYNRRFTEHPRVADLNRELFCLQFSASATFVRHDALTDFGADASLPHAEDAKEMFKVQIRSMRLGLDPRPTYHYRRHPASTIAKTPADKRNYTTYLENFSKWAFDYSQGIHGYVPRCVQGAVIQDLSYLLPPGDGLLSAEEMQKYKSLRAEILHRISFDVIMRNWVLGPVERFAMLCEKIFS